MTEIKLKALRKAILLDGTPEESADEFIGLVLTIQNMKPGQDVVRCDELTPDHLNKTVTILKAGYRPDTTGVVGKIGTLVGMQFDDRNYVQRICLNNEIVDTNSFWLVLVED